MPTPSRSTRPLGHTVQFAAAVLLIWSSANAVETCRIDVVEEGSGWPVPLVELRTNHHVRFISDNAGVIAFDLAELMGVQSWFYVEGHGYEVPKDGFGFQGVRLTLIPGKRLTVKVKRLLPGKRLGRITGGASSASVRSSERSPSGVNKASWVVTAYRMQSIMADSIGRGVIRFCRDIRWGCFT